MYRDTVCGHGTFFEQVSIITYHITRGNRRGGGVVIYTANELSCKMVETKSFAVESILECVTVELAIENHTNVVVSCMYRTPG